MLIPASALYDANRMSDSSWGIGSGKRGFDDTLMRSFSSPSPRCFLLSCFA